MSSVQVLPWIHAEEPINGSTIEIFALWLYVALGLGVGSFKGARGATRRGTVGV